MAGPDPATTEWVPIWNSVSEGPIGPIGPEGPVGPEGPIGDTGPQGIQGVQGPQGIQGLPGEVWFAGVGVPVGSLAGSIVGDWYLDTSTGNVYEKTGASTWTLVTNIKGPQGDQGIQGIQGPQGPAGTAGAHHVSHETGGTDAVVALSGGVITTGTVADIRLSSNVALKNVNNNFAVGQVINGGIDCTSIVARSNIHNLSGAYFYPGRVDTVDGNIQSSWYLGSHASITGLYTPNNFYVAGQIWALVQVYTPRIQFPASHDPSSDANTLDDYEEGAWTPTLNSTGGAPIYSLQTGRYVKIGRYVYYHGRIILSSKNTLGAGIIYMAGLPFVTDNFTGQEFNTMFISNWSGLASPMTHLGGLCYPNNTIIYITCTPGSVTVISNLSVAGIANNLDIIFSGSFTTV